MLGFLCIFSLCGRFFFTLSACSIISLSSSLQIAGISFAFDENIGTWVRVNLCLVLFASLVYSVRHCLRHKLTLHFIYLMETGVKL